MKMEVSNGLKESLPVPAPRSRKKMKVPPPPPPTTKKPAPARPPTKKLPPPPPPVRKSSLKNEEVSVVAPPKRRNRSKTSAELQDIINAANTNTQHHTNVNVPVNITCYNRSRDNRNMYSPSPNHDVRSNFSHPVEKTPAQVYGDKTNMYSPSKNNIRSSFSPVDKISPEIYLQVDCKDQESLSSDFSSLSPCEDRNEDAFENLKQIEENNNALGIQYNNYEIDYSSHDEDFASCTSNMSHTNEERGPSPDVTNAIYEDIKVSNENVTSLRENISNNVELAVHSLEKQVEFQEFQFETFESKSPLQSDDYFMKRSKFTEDLDFSYNENKDNLYSDQSNVSKFEEFDPSDECIYVVKNIACSASSPIPPTLPLSAPPSNVNNSSVPLILSEQTSDTHISSKSLPVSPKPSPRRNGSSNKNLESDTYVSSKSHNYNTISHDKNISNVPSTIQSVQLPVKCASPEPLPRTITHTNNEQCYVEINKPALANERPIYKFFTPPVFQRYDPSTKPWQSNNLAKIKPVEFNVKKKIDIVTPKINNYNDKTSFLASTLNTSDNPPDNPNVSIDWPEIPSPCIRKNSAVDRFLQNNANYNPPEPSINWPEISPSSRKNSLLDISPKIDRLEVAVSPTSSRKISQFDNSLKNNKSSNLSPSKNAKSLLFDKQKETIEKSNTEISSPKCKEGSLFDDSPENHKIVNKDITPPSTRKSLMFENFPQNKESENVVDSNKHPEMSPKVKTRANKSKIILPKSALTNPEEVMDNLSLPDTRINNESPNSISSDELTTDSHIDKMAFLDNSLINEYPQHVRQPSPLCVASSFNAVWSRTGSPETETISRKNSDIFSDIPNLPFGVAAVSPCPDIIENEKSLISSNELETPSENVENLEIIKKSFEDFTKHMLANDYTLIDIPKKADRIRGASKDEEDIVLSHLEAVLMEEVDEWTEVVRSRSASVDIRPTPNDDDDDDDNFEVDWNMFAMEINKSDNNETASTDASKDDELSSCTEDNDLLSSEVNTDEKLNREESMTRTSSPEHVIQDCDGKIVKLKTTDAECTSSTEDITVLHFTRHDSTCEVTQPIEVVETSKIQHQEEEEEEEEEKLTIETVDTMENIREYNVPEACQQEEEEAEEEEEIVEVTLEKMWGSLGIRLELVCDGADEKFMVAIAQIMPGGAAEEAGTLEAGDRLLEVNGQSTSSLEETVKLFRVGPDIVHLRLLRRRISRDENNVYPYDEQEAQSTALEKEEQESGMGSNVSRHSEKGLCRRSQSSGNLAPLPRTKALLVTTSNNSQTTTTTKLCGSLPNHLDRNDDDDPENNNGGMLDLRVKNQRNVELRLQTLLPPPVPSSGTSTNNKTEPLQLLLPPPPLFHDPVNDQGYGSERSPEDENPSPLLPQYPFIKREAVFEVSLTKGTRGLGLSVTGGADSSEPWPGLVRVKRLFPHQPAWQDGRLAIGDVILEANHVPLTGLSNYEALEVLRTAPSEVILRVCRPPAGTGLCSVDPDEQEKPLAPPRYRTLDHHHKVKVTRHPCTSDEDEEEQLSLLSVPNEHTVGEFELILSKVAGSLGFTLRKEDESVLGHYVRALVREPAVSDGRIRPGDKIVAVNGVDISPMSHEEAVGFLRKCGETVTLRLYRDNAQTPVSALSPTEGCKTFPRTRPLLRKEAMDMLSDLAGRKLSSPQESGRPRRSSEGQQPAVPTSPSSSPRRRRLARTPPSPEPSAVQTNGTTNPVADVMEETGRASLHLSLKALASMDSTPDGETPRERPSSLDLSTPSSLRKQKFLFVSPPASSTFSEFGDEDDSGSVIAGLSPPNEYPGPSSLVSQPASMPPIRVDNELTTFSYRNPAYQSAAERPVTVIGNSEADEESGKFLNCIVASPATASSDQDIPKRVFGQEGPQGLLKWKGIVFTPENEEAPKTPSSAVVPALKSGKSTPIAAPKPPPVDLKDRDGTVLTVELTRGWNSRLGFTLHAGDDKTLIKAIYPDSVAFRDGRLKPGDHVIMVNEESIEHMQTSEVIDLVRKIRGTVAITVLRPLDEAR